MFDEPVNLGMQPERWILCRKVRVQESCGETFGQLFGVCWLAGGQRTGVGEQGKAQSLSCFKPVHLQTVRERCDANSAGCSC